MMELKLLWDFVSRHYAAITFIGTPITAVFIPLGRQWIRSRYAFKETEAKCNAQVEIERIRAGISERPNTHMRIDRDSP